MLELYQFELSAYCEKVRLILDYKGLAYKKRDVVPGVGQLELFRLSGQRQVPVLKDGDTYIADSTEIAFYLDPTLASVFPDFKTLLAQLQPLINQIAGRGLSIFYGTFGIILSLLLIVGIAA